MTVHQPICTESGDLDAALYGSFLPIPPDDIFPVVDISQYAREKAPGAIIARKERILINEGRSRIKLSVTNNGDRPIQVKLYTRSLALRINLTPSTDWITLSFHRNKFCTDVRSG